MVQSRDRAETKLEKLMDIAVHAKSGVKRLADVGGLMDNSDRELHDDEAIECSRALIRKCKEISGYVNGSPEKVNSMLLNSMYELPKELADHNVRELGMDDDEDESDIENEVEEINMERLKIKDEIDRKKKRQDAYKKKINK